MRIPPHSVHVPLIIAKAHNSVKLFNSLITYGTLFITTITPNLGHHVGRHSVDPIMISIASYTQRVGAGILNSSEEFIVESEFISDVAIELDEDTTTDIDQPIGIEPTGVAPRPNGNPLRFEEVAKKNGPAHDQILKHIKQQFADEQWDTKSQIHLTLALVRTSRTPTPRIVHFYQAIFLQLASVTSFIFKKSGIVLTGWCSCPPRRAHLPIASL